MLEVSSPGLDRPMKAPKDFERALNETVRIICQPARGGSASGGNGAASHGPVVGKLSAVTELGIELEVLEPILKRGQYVFRGFRRISAVGDKRERQVGFLLLGLSA